MEKKPLSQRDPMPGNVVERLERLMLEKDDVAQLAILGQLLFCFHAGARWNDDINLRKMEVCTKGDISLIVGESLGSKTTRAKEAKTRFLPFVAIGTGLSGLGWASKWLGARKEQFPDE